MAKMNEEQFRQMMGGKAEPKETPAEVEARRERLGTDKATLGDVFAELPEALQRKQDHYLQLYGLKPVFSEEEEQHDVDVRAMMSEEQLKQYRKASDAYRKRGLAVRDKDDRLNDLTSFAATNPPEVLGRHIWRLQRGLDEPLFGRQQEPKRKQVREYSASLFINICDDCADDLRSETEASGAERPAYGKDRERIFYEHDAPNGHYQFRYENLYVEKAKGGFVTDFPYSDSKECVRCSTTDADLWRDRFGEE